VLVETRRSGGGPPSRNDQFMVRDSSDRRLRVRRVSGWVLPVIELSPDNERMQQSRGFGQGTPTRTRNWFAEAYPRLARRAADAQGVIPRTAMLAAVRRA
jgi:hypothetical protein